MPILNAIVVVGTLVSSIVIVMAWIAIWITALRDKVAQGLLCLLVPVYAYYYAFANRIILGSTMRILWGWTAVFVALMTFMLVTKTLQFLLYAK